MRTITAAMKCCSQAHVQRPGSQGGPSVPTAVTNLPSFTPAIICKLWTTSFVLMGHFTSRNITENSSDVIAPSASGPRDCAPSSPFHQTTRRLSCTADSFRPTNYHREVWASPLSCPTICCRPSFAPGPRGQRYHRALGAAPAPRCCPTMDTAPIFVLETRVN